MSAASLTERIRHDPDQQPQKRHDQQCDEHTQADVPHETGAAKMGDQEIPSCGQHLRGEQCALNRSERRTVMERKTSSNPLTNHQS